MKTNWKYAIMALAAVVSMAACNDKDEPKHGGDGDGDGDGDAFVSPITIDGTFADWDALPAAKVVSATCAANAPQKALKTLKVYADKMYLNIYVEFDETLVTDKSWVPFHVYMDTDNSALTGGYGDEFAEADIDLMCEGGIFSEGAAVSYNPAVFKWWGNVGEDGWLWTDPSVAHDEADFWGALVGEGQGAIGTSACTGNKLEIQLLREAMPATFANTFGVGVDIQQNWSSVGILPNANEVEGEAKSGLAPKLRVTVDQ